MNTIRNIHFTLLIRVNNKLCEFNFRKRQDNSYDGDTSDDRGNRFYFKVMPGGEHWILQGNNLPKWITDNVNIIIDSLLSSKPA